VLNDGFAGVQEVGVGDVVEKEKQFVGSCGKRFMRPHDWRRILADKARARGYGAIHTDTVVVGAVPLPPGIERSREAIHYVF
jgi:hypothetical protein